MNNHELKEGKRPKVKHLFNSSIGFQNTSEHIARTASSNAHLSTVRRISMRRPSTSWNLKHTYPHRWLNPIYVASLDRFLTPNKIDTTNPFSTFFSSITQNTYIGKLQCTKMDPQIKFLHAENPAIPVSGVGPLIRTNSGVLVNLARKAAA